MEKWKKEREDAITRGEPDPYEGLDERCFNWVKVREVKDSTGTKSIAKPKTREVVGNIKRFAEAQKAGKFVPDKEKDSLAVALCTKEHCGRVRGISSKLNWKEGFAKDLDKYKKHDRYKEEMREMNKEEMNTCST